jgi:hypothetical protein
VRPEWDNWWDKIYYFKTWVFIQRLILVLVDNLLPNYLPDDIFLLEKRCEDNFVGALCSVKFLENNGVKITAKVGESEVVLDKPKGKKK